MTVDQLKIIASLITNVRITKENTRGQYDVDASINAASDFDHYCQNINANSIADFIKQLDHKITQRKSNMSSGNAGEYNGGKGTLGSCFNELLDIVEKNITFSSAHSSLREELQSLGGESGLANKSHISRYLFVGSLGLILFLTFF